jgi:hypothetical protein
MKNRPLIVIASALFVLGSASLLGCEKEKESPTSTAAADAGHASTMASASASAAPSAAPSATAMAAPVSTAIPSQADESMAAAKEIDKSNYKTELSSIASELK